MKMRYAAAAMCLAVCSAHAQAILNPPYGMRWGDSPEKLITWASRHSLDVNISLPGDQPSMRVVRISARKGFLPETRAGAMEGRFIAGKLFELAVHYVDAEASADVMLTRFEELRKQVATEHGALLTNQQQRVVEDQFATRTRSFHREPVKGLFLLLAFTEVEDLLRNKVSARFSLIYRNDNFKEEMLKSLTAP